MPWTDPQWAMFCSILKRGFAAKDPFTTDDANVYRLLLDDVDPEGAMAAVKAIVLEGQALRPRPGEIVARVRRDPGKPTFEEAFALIFGPRGVLAARPGNGGPVTYNSQAERRQAENTAALERAADLHPLVASFVQRQGVTRLRELPVVDPDFGEIRRKELRDAWDRHCEAMDGRDVAALASGDRSALGLRKLDPLAALGLKADEPAGLEAAS